MPTWGKLKISKNTGNTTMGERKAPPLAILSPTAPGSAGSKQASLKWPPAGWPMFACVTRESGMAFKTSQTRTADDYLQYQVSTASDGVYELQIISGTIGRDGTSQSPVIGIRFAAREDWFDDNPQKAVLDIHVCGQRLIPERGAVLRVILAMTFIISRIDRGIAPSIGRVMKMYRLQ
jgi:hypothetical protein